MSSIFSKIFEEIKKERENALFSLRNIILGAYNAAIFPIFLVLLRIFYERFQLYS